MLASTNAKRRRLPLNNQPLHTRCETGKGGFMEIFTAMSPLQAAGLYIGLLTFLLAGLKVYVGVMRGKLRVRSGDMSDPAFARAARVQLNAVEDVPVLLIGLLALAFLQMPVWYIHMTGGVLLVARLAHAFALARADGLSVGRIGGTAATELVFLAVGGALVFQAFQTAA